MLTSKTVNHLSKFQVKLLLAHQPRYIIDSSQPNYYNEQYATKCDQLFAEFLLNSDLPIFHPLSDQGFQWGDVDTLKQVIYCCLCLF